MKIKKCRNCESKEIKKLFTLGNLSYSGFFPASQSTKVEKKNLTLVKCSSCHLVQLDEKFNPKKLYNNNYGYRTGINSTMTNHVKNIVKQCIKLTGIKRNEYVLDIASNDGTLLNFYPNNIIKFGCDPLISKYKKFYKNIQYKVSDFFTYKNIRKKLNKSNKFKIITSIAVFYDLEKPNQFLKDVSKLLSDDGVFLLELADLYQIIKNTMFDTICHEHIEYYSCDVIRNMVEKNQMRIIKLEHNASNGGSTRFFICHKNSKYKSDIKNIKKFINNETKIGLKSMRTYRKFYSEIHRSKKKLINLVNNILKKKQTIFGYGASTKGNILLDYFGLTDNEIKYIADRNPEKDGKFTPTNKIPIISEAKAHKLKPNYYLVLPWHFKKEILEREKKKIKGGVKFIFPLPKLKVY
jgi:hypothetical protein